LLYLVHTVFFGDDYVAEFEDIFDRGRVTEQPTVYICAQDRGHGRHAVDGARERLFMLVNAPPKPMSDDDLRRVVENTFSGLASHGLGIREVESVVLLRPDDFAERFPGSDGAIYGWPTHGWSGSFRRGGSRSRLEGLYLAGGTVHPGPGVPMAAISGRLAAASVLSDIGIRR
jgi:1-hydroxycarotenoid 3,4-desaturase